MFDPLDEPEQQWRQDLFQAGEDLRVNVAQKYKTKGKNQERKRIIAILEANSIDIPEEV